MKKRLFKSIALSVSLFVLGCAYAFISSNYGLSIPCLFNKITGLKCPGCGVSRMCVSILNLDFKAAFSYNPVIFIFLPVGVILYFKSIYRYIRYGINRFSAIENNIMIIMIVILIIFGIIRNFV